jgi:hypothetical protein
MCSVISAVTHRVAISNHRLVSFADHKVTFRGGDSAHNNEQRLMNLSLHEFLRRFLLHSLPDGSAQLQRRRPNKTSRAPATRAIFGSAPSVPNRWWSLRG